MRAGEGGDPQSLDDDLNADQFIERQLASLANLNRDRANDEHDGEIDPDAAWVKMRGAAFDPDLANGYFGPIPELPVDIFGAFWRGWILDSAAGKGCPPDYIVAALLASASALLSRHRSAQPWEDWQEPPIMWSGCVGQPSSGKSPGIDAATDPLRRLEIENDADYPDRIRAWKASVMEAELHHADWEKQVRMAVAGGFAPPPMPAKAEEPEKPEPRRLILTDATVQKILIMSSSNEQGLVLVRDELAGWIGGMDQFSGKGSDRAFYLESYGGRSYTSDRVSRDKPVFTSSLALAICGGIQPDRLGTMLLNGDDDGLTARFLYFWPESRQPKRPTTVSNPGAALTRLRKLSTLALAHDGKRIAMPLDASAVDMLCGWRQEIYEAEKLSAGLLTSWLGKMPGTALRIGLILEYLTWCGDRSGQLEPTQISAVAMANAINFLRDYAAPMARRTFGEAGLPQGQRDCITLARWLRNSPPVELVNARELRIKSALSTKDAGRYDTAIGELVEAGWLVAAPRRQGGTKGRPTKDFSVNPAVWKSAP